QEVVHFLVGSSIGEEMAAAGKAVNYSRRYCRTAPLDAQCPVLDDGPRAFPRIVERGAQLARATGSVQVGFTLDAPGKAAEVVAAAVVGQEGRWIVAVDRVGHLAENEHRGHALGQRQQRRL